MLDQEHQQYFCCTGQCNHGKMFLLAWHSLYQNTFIWKGFSLVTADLRESLLGITAVDCCHPADSGTE